MILTDSSIWIDHFRQPEREMTRLLRRGSVLMHEFVLGELWMGNFHDRPGKLHSLSKMKQCVTASTEEVMILIEGNRLYGRGIGWIDAHLVASCHLTEALQLWTRDRRLAAIAKELDVLAELA